MIFLDDIQTIGLLCTSVKNSVKKVKSLLFSMASSETPFNRGPHFKQIICVVFLENLK